MKKLLVQGYGNLKKSKAKYSLITFTLLIIRKSQITLQTCQ